MKNIVLFGGVFDPVHIGHLAVYKTIKKHIKFDKFIVIPSKNPPLKKHAPKAKAKDRVAMLTLMFNQYKDVKISLYEALQKHNEVSYTIKTLKHVKEMFPHDQLYFVIGTDRYLDFKKWKDWKQILELTKLIVIKRSDEKIKKVIPATFIDIKPVPISSTQLRAVPFVKYLTEPVANYIAEHGFYATSQIIYLATANLMSKKRLEHTLRVTNLALDICECTNIKLFKKAFLAAMYHDIAKEFSDQQIKKLVGNFHSKCYPTIHTMHGIASAEYARKFLNIKDREVLNAIANHVIPPKNPSELDMIIYCADKLEPNRTKDDIKDRLGCIALAKKNLKVAFTKVYNETCAHYN